MRKVFKIIAIIFTCLLVIGCLVIVVTDDNPTFADAGFSTSHDSGGSSSWSSSDSWSSSSSWDSSSYDSDSSSEGASWIWVLIMIIWIIYEVFFKTNTTRNSNPSLHIDHSRLAQKDLMTERIIKQYHLPNFDKREFIQNQYDNYCKIQVAWMDFKLEDIKELVTDELYTMWSSQLDTLELKGEQNIMGSFELEAAYLTDASLQNGNLTITTEYLIKTYDYIVDSKTKRLVRGNKSQRMRIHYKMKFRVALDHMNTIDKCPSCGNPIEHNTSSICPFCRSQLFVEPKNWVLTEKTCLGQEYTR